MEKNSRNSICNETNENALTDKEWLELSWNYFSRLSEQRMGMINFYIVIVIALIGALFTMISRDTRVLWTECAVCLTVTLFSVVFSLLDYRTKLMIHCCEEIIEGFEAQYSTTKDENNLPFHLITKKTEDEKIRVTYSSVFRIVFWILGILGVVFSALLLCRVI